MAAPVINTSQSVLGFRQWEVWQFQPWASNSPTFWNASGLPAGVAFNTTTGKLTGPSNIPGVFLFSLVAGNTDGSSEPVVFALGIEPSSKLAPANSIDLMVDVTTKAVTVASSTTATTSEARPSPIIYCKAGDDLVVNVRFTKGGVPFEMNLTDLKMVCRENDPDGNLVTSSAWAQDGDGQDAVYTIHLKMDSDALRAALSDYEDDDLTAFPALTEIQWTEDNTLALIVGPSALVGTTRTFTILVPRDFIANS